MAPRKKSAALPPIDLANLDASLAALGGAVVPVVAIKSWTQEIIEATEPLAAALNVPSGKVKVPPGKKDYARATPKPVYPVVDPRTVPVRYSSLKQFAQSADHYHHACQNGRDETLAMRMGSGCHAMMFGEPVEEWDGKVRNGWAWDEFSALHADKLILSIAEHRVASDMKAKLLQHQLASAIMFAPGTQYETHISWTRNGRACSSKPDGRLRGGVLNVDEATGHYFVTVEGNSKRGILWDYKTTKSAAQDYFIRDAIKRGYPGQCVFYGEALEATEQWTPDAYYLIAQENVKPYTVAVYQLPPKAIELGEQSITAWWEQLRACEASNRWPGYSDAPIFFDVPSHWQPSDDDEGDDDETESFEADASQFTFDESISV